MKIKNKDGVSWLSRDREKQNKKKIKGCAWVLGLVCWTGFVFGPNNKRKENGLITSPFSSSWVYSGPLGLVGPRSMFRGSGFNPIILVINLGNFRKFRNYINIVR